ncbi:MAG: response regulator [Elusimicrobia bacterium]|nr:response regulator [Elusimicrobiota bacterium]
MKYKILVVDDEPVIRQLVTKHLEKRGHAVFTASDGVEAMALVQREKPHLVLLDIRMPNMDGIEFLQQVRKISQDILVIVLTAYDDLRLQTMRLGSNDYITKPFHLDYLDDRIRSILASKAPFLHTEP